MNANLRLTSYLENHNWEFPRHADLRLHLAQECEALKVALAEAERKEDIAPGYREQYVWLERFGLRAADLSLFTDGDAYGAIAAPVHLRTDFEETTVVYLRNTFWAHALLPRADPGRWWHLGLCDGEQSSRGPRDAGCHRCTG